MLRGFRACIFRCDSISRNTLYTGYSVSHSVTQSQSANNLLGQGARPFRQSKDVKIGNITIKAITAIMAIIVSMAIAAITAITDIRASTSSTVFRGNVDNTTTSANREMYAMKANNYNKTIIQPLLSLEPNMPIIVIMVNITIVSYKAKFSPVQPNCAQFNQAQPNSTQFNSIQPIQPTKPYKQIKAT